MWTQVELTGLSHCFDDLHLDKLARLQQQTSFIILKTLGSVSVCEGWCWLTLPRYNLFSQISMVYQIMTDIIINPMARLNVWVDRKQRKSLKRVAWLDLTKDSTCPRKNYLGPVWYFTCLVDASFNGGCQALVFWPSEHTLQLLPLKKQKTTVGEVPLGGSLSSAPLK